MLQKYVVVHVPTGAAVVVSAYTPEEAHRKALPQLNKYAGAAGQAGAGSANAGNTAILSQAGTPTASKLSSAGATPTALPSVVTLAPGHTLPAGFVAPAHVTVKKSDRK